MTTTPKIYPTTNFQQYYYHRNQQNLYSVFIVAAKYAITSPHLTKPSSEASFNFVLHHALSNMLRLHPTLCLNIFDEEPKAEPVAAETAIAEADSAAPPTSRTFPPHPKSQYVALCSTLSLPNLVTHHTLPENYSTQDLERFINTLQQEQIQNYGQNDNVTWKMHVLNQEWIFVAFDHALFDGLSGAHFHQEFIQHLSTAVELLPELQKQVQDDGKDLNEVLNTPLWTYAQFCLSLQPESSQATTPICSSIPKSTEHYIDCKLGWTDTATTVCNEVLPQVVKSSLSSLSQTIFSSDPFVYSAADGTDTNTSLYAFQPLTTPSYPHLPTPGQEPTLLTTEVPALPTVTYIPGNFSNRVRLMKVAGAKLEHIRTAILRPQRLRFSAFMLYLISIAMLPITGTRAVQLSIPTNVRHYIKDHYTSEQAALPSSPSIQHLHPDPLLFGCFIGSCSLSIKSPAFFTDALKATFTAPNPAGQTVRDAEIARFEAIKALVDQQVKQRGEAGLEDKTPQPSTLISPALLNHLSTSLGQQLKTPTSEPNGLFNGLGMLSLGASISGIQQTVEKLSNSPRSGTVELSNLGTVKVSQTALKDGASVSIADMIFTQPSACPGNFITFNAVAVESDAPSTDITGDAAENKVNKDDAGITLSIAAIPHFTDEQVDRIVQLLQYLIENVEAL